MRVERREVSARARRNPAAERRVLEALRVVAQGEAVRGELLLEVRPEGPRLDARRPRRRVHLEHPVHRAEVHRDRAVPRAPAGPLHAADDARPAAERHDGEPLALAPREHRRDLRLVAREGDHVGRAREVAAEGAREIRGSSCRACASRGRAARPRRTRRPPRVAPRAPRACAGPRASAWAGARAPGRRARRRRAARCRGGRRHPGSDRPIPRPRGSARGSWGSFLPPFASRPPGMRRSSHSPWPSRTSSTT